MLLVWGITLCNGLNEDQTNKDLEDEDNIVIKVANIDAIKDDNAVINYQITGYSSSFIYTKRNLLHVN